MPPRWAANARATAGCSAAPATTIASRRRRFCDDGLITCFAGCDRGDVLAELRRLGLYDGRVGRRQRLAPRVPSREEMQARERERAERERKARWLWSLRRPIRGTPAERYLREVRGITCDLPATLGYLPPRDEHPHAMIAAFGVPTEPKPGMLAIAEIAVRAVHLTRLAPDGRGKAVVDKPKKVIASPRGSPIALAPPNDLLALAITEGIEDAMSVHQAMGWGAWAAGSAGFLPALAEAVPRCIEVVHVLVDDNSAGRRNSAELVRRLRERGFAAAPHLLRSEVAV